MSVNQPPDPNVDTFNNAYWIPDPNDANLDGKYLRFPIAQGAETLQQTTINGDLTLNQSKIHLGTSSGITQGTNSVAIGASAGNTQGLNAVALGYLTAQTNQGNNGTALGHNAGNSNQGTSAVAIGHNAGEGLTTGQGNNAIAIGFNSARTSQSTNAIAIGHNAGDSNQGTTAIAIGRSAGQTSQGNNSIAIGHNSANANQALDCIQINATGTTIAQTTSQSCIIAPVRFAIPATAQGSYPLLYNGVTNEVFYSAEQSLNITLNVALLTLNNNAYNRFIFISTNTAGTNRINLPTPVVQFPASVTIFNATGLAAFIGSTIASGLRQGNSPATAQFALPANSAITYHTNGSLWIRTSAI